MHKEYTPEQLLERWEDIHEIENLMGRRSVYKLLVKDREEFDELWSKNDPCLGFNNGYYKGYDAVKGYAAALAGYALLRAELAGIARPDALGGKEAGEIVGAGALHVEGITTPLIELAEDRETAKGLFYAIGAEFDYGLAGWASNMSWGRLGVDFIKEGGKWKILHLVFAEDINTPLGTNWTGKKEPRAGRPLFSKLGEFKFPEPNVPLDVHERWHETRPLKEFPPMPVPYRTFSETFSYGA